MAEVTPREEEILGLVQSGVNSPSEVAEKLGISQPGASQALAKLAEKGRLVRRKSGRMVRYQTVDKWTDADQYFLSQAYNALSQVWAFVMSIGSLTEEEMKKAREARDYLERILAKKHRVHK
jgi:predicted ArsR family transcriptional regulator